MEQKNIVQVCTLSFVLLMIFYCFPGFTELICMVFLGNKMACSVESLERFRPYCGFSWRYLDCQMLGNASALTEELPAPTGCTEQREILPYTAPESGLLWKENNHKSSFFVRSSESPDRKGRFAGIFKAFSLGRSAFEAVIAQIVTFV